MKYTIEDLNDYMLFHGQKRIGDFELTNSFTKLIVDINSLDIPEVTPSSKLINKFILKKHAYSFFNDYYNLHKIGYLPDNKLKKIMSARKVSNINEITDIYNKSAVEINPLKLPIYANLNNPFEGRLVVQDLLCDEDKEKDILSNINVFFTGIRIPKRITELTTASYIHEVTHSQLESYKGIIEDYNNIEVLSIFNELFYAYTNCDKKVFKELLVNRLNNLLLSFASIYDYKEADFITTIKDGREYGEFDYHSDLKYLLSTLKALKMFVLCIEDNVQKYHIIKIINKVFNGEYTVEDLLNELKINNNEPIKASEVKALLKQ